MQFIVIAHDGTDAEALTRRMAARPAHIALAEKMKAAKQTLYGVAILNDQRKMIGSMMVMEFPSRRELEEWMKIEPYLTGNVWQKVEILDAQVGPSFAPGSAH